MNAPIIQIKNVRGGEAVSYGGIDILKKDSILATVGILSLPILLQSGNTHFKHALEWNYFVGVILFYLLSRFFWRRTT